MGLPIVILLAIITFFLIGCILVLTLHIIKFRKYVDKYEKVWSKFENKDIKEDVENLIQNMEITKQISMESKGKCDLAEQKINMSIQKTGFVKYDAYDGGKNGLSFSLAMLDGRDDGILLNSIYTRNGCNIYAKEIIEGSYSGNLSDEEQKALQIAKNKKTFM